MNRLVMVMAILAFGLSADGHGQDDRRKPVSVGWETLAFEEKSFHDPFAKLSPEQLQNVSYALRVARLISEKKLSPDGSDATRATKIARDLEEQHGFDLAWLMAQRRAVRKLREQQVEEHAASVAKKFRGKQVTLYGFAVPIGATSNGGCEFFLVPSVDFCNSSAPPSTQVVFVKSPQQIAINNRTTPMSVTGSLQQRPTHQTFVYPGRVIHVEAEYAIEPTGVKVELQTRSAISGDKQ